MKKVHYNRIKSVLADLGVNNKELAKGLGLTDNTISRWCRNEMQPSLPTLFEIADFLKVDVKELIGTNKNSPVGGRKG